jgi:AcrR family transcriptional regulator
MTKRQHRELGGVLDEYLGDLAKVFHVEGTSVRLMDAAGELFLKQGSKILERFAGAKDPKTPKEIKRRRILLAATELFIRQGFRKTSVDEVAQAAGVAKGTVYLYFKNKSDLLMNCIALEKLQFVGGIMDVLKGDMSSKEKLRAYLREVFILVNRMPLVSRLMSGDAELLYAMEDMGVNSMRALDLQAAFFAFLVRRAAGPTRWTREELEDRAKVLVGLMYSAGFMNDPRINGGLELERYASILADMLIDGIAAPQAALESGGDR